MQHFNEAIHFASRVVKIKTGAGGGGDAELFVQRLRAVMANADGHALLISEGSEIQRVHIFKNKTHQTTAFRRWPKNAYALEFAQPLFCVIGQFAAVGVDGVEADGVEVIECRVKPCRAGDVGRAGFEFVRGHVEFRFVKLNFGNHFPTALIRGHRFLQFAAGEQRADAGGAAHFVSGESKKIASESLHI